jgi:hypothetical protein
LWIQVQFDLHINIDCEKCISHQNEILYNFRLYWTLLFLVYFSVIYCFSFSNKHLNSTLFQLFKHHTTLMQHNFNQTTIHPISIFKFPFVFHMHFVIFFIFVFSNILHPLFYTQYVCFQPLFNICSYINSFVNIERNNNKWRFNFQFHIQSYKYKFCEPSCFHVNYCSIHHWLCSSNTDHFNS